MCFGLSYDLCFSRTLLLSGYVSCDFIDIYFMFYLSLLPYVSLMRTMSSFSPSQTPQLPSTLVYCTSLIVLRSRSRIPLQHIHSLVYIPPVLVATTSELILLTSPSYLSEVLRNARNLRLSSGRLLSPLFLYSLSPARVLVWTVDSCPPDSIFSSSLGTSGSGRIRT